MSCSFSFRQLEETLGVVKAYAAKRGLRVVDVVISPHDAESFAHTVPVGWDSATFYRNLIDPSVGANIADTHLVVSDRAHEDDPAFELSNHSFVFASELHRPV